MICKKCGYRTENEVLVCPFCGYDERKENKDDALSFSNNDKNDNDNKDKKVVNLEYNGPTYDDYEKEDNEKIIGIRNSLGYLNLKTKSWHHLLYGCAGYMFLQFFFQIFGSILIVVYQNKGYDFSCVSNKTCSVEVDEVYSFISALSQVVGELLIVLITCLIFLKFLKHFFKEFKNKKTWYWFGIGFGLMYGSTLVYSIILNVLGLSSTSSNQDSVNSIIFNTPLLGFLFVVVAAPLFEELIFRFGLFRTFTHKNKKMEIIGIIVTTIAFAMIHMVATFQEVFADPNVPNYALLKSDLLSLPSYLIGAFCLTYAYYKSKNLLTPMLMHMTWNAMSFIAIIGNSVQSSQVISLIIQFIARLF